MLTTYRHEFTIPTFELSDLEITAKTDGEVCTITSAKIRKVVRLGKKHETVIVDLLPIMEDDQIRSLEEQGLKSFEEEMEDKRREAMGTGAGVLI